MYRNMSMRNFFFLCTFVFSAMNLKAQSAAISYPVTLNYPYHLDTIDNRRPTFSWQCDLATITLDPRLDMQFVLVEKNKNQPIGEALLINQPLLFAYSLTNSSLSYPSSNQELIPGHTYAWQVSVMMNGMPIMQSQQTEFTIREDKEKENNYWYFTTTASAVTYQLHPNKKILVKIPYTKENIVFFLEQGTERKRLEAEETETLKGYTNNKYYTLDLSEMNIENSKIYTLIYKASGKAYQLKFKGI